VVVEFQFQKLWQLVMLCISCMWRSIMLTVIWWKADISYSVTVFFCRSRVGNIYQNSQV